MLRRCCGFGLLWVLSGLTAYAATVRVDEAPATIPINLTSHWTMLEDPSLQWSVDDVNKAELGERFKRPRNQSDSLNFGLRRSAIWLRVTLRNAGANDLDRLLEVGYPHLHQVELYVPKAQTFQRFATGGSHPFAERPLSHRNFVFPLHLAAGSEDTYYLRVVSPTTLDIPTKLWEPQAFNQQSLYEYIGQALYFGMLLALGMYNLLLFASLRDRAYFYYVLFAGANALSLLAYSGIGFQFLWPDSAEWSIIATMVGFATTGLTLLIFQRRMLTTRKTVPWLDRVMCGFIVLNALQIIGFMWSFDKMIRLGIAIDALNMMLAFIASIACVYRGQRSARFFLVAFSCLLVAAVLTALRSFGLWLPNFITTYGMQIGSALEMLLLSLALADRFHQIRQEKESMQQDLVENLKRSERILEQRVTQRTEELSRTNAELIRHKLALEAAKEGAESASRMKSAFLSTMSHEIRTPMNAIVGMAYLALRTDLTARQRDYVEKVHHSAVSLLGIINGILDFSKIEAGKLEIDKIGFMLEDVLDNVTTVTSQHAHEKRLEYLFDVASDVPNSLVGDPLRLGQVLINLISNAIKFTEYGEIHLRCEVSNSDADWVELKFEIRDTGIGMTPNQQRKIFHAFTQADGSATREHGGTGLGLTISKRLVELMGGAITVHSEYGVGSIFRFTARYGLGTQPETAPISIQNVLLDKRVLVVDDNAAAREILVRILEGFHMHAIACSSAKEALAKILQADAGDAYDLVLADLGMPGMSGLELANAIADAGLLHVPNVILVTAFARDDVQQQVDNKSIAGILFKPIGHSLLHDTMTNVFARDAARRVAACPRRSLPRFDGGRVLLVEDNVVNQQIALEMLRASGLQVDVADNGRLALEQLFAEEPDTYDLVLMDIQMPELGGHGAARRIRLDQRYAALPIVAMTAHATVEEREACLQSGMQDHIAKPINPDQFYQTLTRWIKRKQCDNETTSRMPSSLMPVPPSAAGA